MKLRIEDIEIPKDKPFQNCELGRQPYADILEGIVKNGKDGCVMSLDGAWGTGKTTFVRMWQQQLVNHGFNTVYFNAWEHDYMTDPLVALMGELYDLSIKSKAENTFKKVVAEGVKIFSAILPSFAKAIAKNYIGDEAADAVSGAFDETKNIFQKELDKYKEECDSLDAFRTALAEYAESISSDKPLVFIVDELDRCNPTYAVKVLERIKHLFAIPHIVFVLAIDKEQLCNSIRGFYGSDSINAAEYLRRFIDVEYYLPTPDYEKFFDYIYKKLEFKDFFTNNSEGNSCSADSQEEILKTVPLALLKAKGLTLRQVEKFMIHLRLALQTFPVRHQTCPDLVALMIYLRQYEYSLYSDIKNRKLEIKDLVQRIENVFSSEIYESADSYQGELIQHGGVFLTIELILSYMCNNRVWANCNNLWENQGDNICHFKYKTSMPQNELNDALKHYSQQSYKMPIDYIVKHIEILCALQKY